MSEPRPHPDADPGRPSATGSWRPDARPVESADPPTVISGSGSVGSGLTAAASSGSGSNRGASGSGSGLNAGQGPSGSGTPWPAPGDRIDSFQVDQAIGIGGMGAVFRAFDTKLDRVVALKVLPPDQAEDVEVVQRFYQEGRAAARLDHENIARVFTIGRDAKYHYIAFEYIEGQTLRQKVDERGPLSINDAINYTLQIAGALGHAVERGVVHRDIKPSNIIVTATGRAKLVDMGLARHFERGRDNGLTQSGMTLGTFDYISPEQARDPRDVDVRGDLYSLGCTLFHMLTGRPPFPEGTVLQKLLQHQEEAPPDVREINPHVPAELAAVVRKLMLKDRDRRYQTPESLIRDLLVLAGHLGLRPVSPEGLVWVEPTARPAWEKHLVWGVPALGFLLLVGVLFWFNEPPKPAGNSATGLGGPSLVARSGAPDPFERIKGGAATVASSAEAAKAVGGTAAPARDIEVDSGQNLIEVIRNAPPKANLLLVDAGPYLLRLPADGAKLKNLDVTLRAEQGIRPVLRMAGVSLRGATKPAALLDLAGGRVTLDGLDLIGSPELDAILRAEDSDVTLRRCQLRRPTPGGSRGPQSAVRISSTGKWGADGRTEASLSLNATHADGGPYGIRAEGEVEVALRDCTFGPAEVATFASEHPGGYGGPSDFQLAQVTVLAGEGPVFLAEGLSPRIRARDCLFAPEASGAGATLLTCDSPDQVDYRGFENLYARFAAYLRPSRPGEDARGRGPVRSFSVWSESGTQGIRESGSVAIDASPWQVAGAGSEADPAFAFRFSAPDGLRDRLGARTGPLGRLSEPTTLASSRVADSREPEAASRPVEPIDNDATALALATNPFNLLNQVEQPDRGGDNANAPETPARPADPLDNIPPPMAPMAAEPPRTASTTKPMAVPPAAEDPDAELFGGAAIPPPMTQVAEESRKNPPAIEPGRSDGPAATKDDASTPTRVAAANPGTGRGPSNPPGGASNPNLIRTAAELLERITRADSRGGTLNIKSDADFDLPPFQVKGAGVWTIKASGSNRRPRFRLRSNAEPARFASNANSAWNLGLDVQGGGLRLEGIDLVVPADAAGGTAPWAAFGLRSGTDLNLTNCTVTIEGNRPKTAMVAVLDDSRARDEADRPDEGPRAAGSRRDEPAGLPPTVRLKDCLIRLGGVLVDVAAGARLDLAMENAAVSTGDSLVHGHGRARGTGGETLKVDLRQVTARLTGGLVYLESTPGEPELPIADVVVRESVLANNGDGTPLFRLDGQDDPDTLRDRLKWQGQRVGYHLISLYRRDQSSQPGAIPSVFDRASWDVLAGRREEFAIHGDLRFRRPWDTRQPLWNMRRNDFQLAPDSPAAALGADLAQIPDVPTPL